MTEFIATFFFLFAVIDPIGSVPVYLEATREFNAMESRRIAIRASGLAFLILLFFIIAGQLIFEGMNVTLHAFQVSGGVILFLFALTMIFGDGKPARESSNITDYKHVLVFPVAVPSIASPGAIMAVVVATDNHIYTLQQQAFTTFMVFLVIALTALLLLIAKRVQRTIGDYGITVISKVMGLIIASYAAQSILTGIRGYFLSYN